MKFENRVSSKYKWMMLFLAGAGYTCANGCTWLYYGYYALIQARFGATNTQMGYLGTITGLAMIICWPLGGIIADKIKMRVAYVGCMIFSIANFAILAFSSVYTVYMLSVLISCLMTGVYYTLFGKIVKGVSTPTTEGKNSGFFWAIFAAANSVIGAIGSYLVGKMDTAGWSPLMFMFLALSVIMGIVCLLTLDDSKFNDWSVLEKSDDAGKFQFSQVGKVLLMPELWVAGLIYFTMLMITCAGTMAVNMMGTIYMVPLGIITFLGVFRTYLGRVILSPTSGAMIDKMGSSMSVIRILLVITMIGFVLFFVFPMNSDYFWVAILLVAACTIGYGMQATCWITPISEIKVPIAYHGTAIGVYNAIGCISDAFIYVITGAWIDKYGDITGNRIGFAFIGVMLVICFILTMIESRMIAKRRAALGWAKE